MKKTFALILALFCVFSLVACAANSNSDNDIINQPYFYGKVVERYDNSCLVEVTDKGNQYFSIGDLISVSTNIESCPEYAVGDTLRIAFDGSVAESYPMQIHKVSSITKAE